MFKIILILIYVFVNNFLFAMEYKYGNLIYGGIAPLNPIMQKNFAMNNSNGEILISNLSNNRSISN